MYLQRTVQDGDQLVGGVGVERRSRTFSHIADGQAAAGRAVSRTSNVPLVVVRTPGGLGQIVVIDYRNGIASFTKFL